MNPLYPDTATRAEWRCEYCRAPEQVFNFAFEVEHITPRALNGNNAPGNLALACASCNLFKADAVAAEDELTAQIVPLFHPRRDKWHEHFSFDADTGRVAGETPAGRATVLRLRINSGFQVRARRHWARLGLYP